MSSQSKADLTGDTVGSLEDGLHSLRNAVKLGLSLVATWSVALGIRLVLPRHLGPELFGAFQFADAFTSALFVLASFGVETYMRKEVATRPDHANEFWGGVLACRMAVSVLLLAGMTAFLVAAGRSRDVVVLVILMGVVQALTVVNHGHAALLHSVGSVDGLSLLNVVSKVLWGVAIVAGLALGGGVVSVGVGALLSEVLRTVGLWRLTRRHLDLRLQFDLARTKAVLVASLPFYLLSLAQITYARIDVSLMSFLTSDVEVGWYGAAANVAGLALLITPLIGWVLLPLTSRAQARSDEELNRVVRRSLELTLTLVIPISLLLCLGADVFVRTAFGAAFEPSIPSLRLIAPMFVLTYVAMIASTVLMRIGREWTLTGICVGGMIVNPTLNWFLIPAGMRAFGPGGAGIAAAGTQVATEAMITIVALSLIGRRAFDARNVSTLARTAAVCAVVIVFDRFGGLPGWVRVAADAAVYALLAVAFGAVRPGELLEFVRLAWKRKETKYATA